MWRGTRTGSVLLFFTLAAAADAAAKPARRGGRAQPVVTSSDVEPVFEAEPRPTAPVLRDPEILTRGEMLSLVKKLSADMADALLDGERQREVAIRKKDAIKLSCIQDRLSNMKLMKKLSDDRQAATERKDIQGDQLRLRHEFRGVELAHQRIVELHRELMECVGQSLEVSGEPSDIGLAPGESTNVGSPPAVERPTTASTYR